jgi:hypothetical protein
MKDRSNPLLQEFQHLIETLFMPVTPASEPRFEYLDATRSPVLAFQTVLLATKTADHGPDAQL